MDICAMDNKKSEKSQIVVVSSQNDCVHLDSVNYVEKKLKFFNYTIIHTENYLVVCNLQ